MKYLPIFLFVFLIAACQSSPKEQTAITEETNGLDVTVKDFGNTSDGPAQLYTLTNKNGISASICDYGGIVTHLLVPDKNGVAEDIVLGFDSMHHYLAKHPYFGTIIGRYANRVADAEFKIGETTYPLFANDGANSLHGGKRGFDKKLWGSKKIETKDFIGVELTTISRDMDEGYPGNLRLRVNYLLNNKNEFIIEYHATTDKTTFVNLTNHSYYNLKGAGNGDILDHQLQINASSFTPVNKDLIPNGKLQFVANTPFDFQNPTTIGDRINDKHPQLKYGDGYDHNFVLKASENRLRPCATVYEPTSGRVMEILTTEPGVQFYSGNFLDGSLIGKGNKTYKKRFGFCLETQHYPDSPNQKNFPSTLLQPGQIYSSETVHRFSVR